MEIDDFLVMDYFTGRMNSSGMQVGIFGSMFVTPVGDEDRYYINRLEKSNNENSIV